MKHVRTYNTRSGGITTAAVTLTQTGSSFTLIERGQDKRTFTSEAEAMAAFKNARLRQGAASRARYDASVKAEFELVG